MSKINMSLYEAIDAYIKHLADDYGTNDYSNKKFYIAVGRKYAHVIMEDNQRSSHSWVMLADDKKFKQGDILKSASWNAPARNFARGNVLCGGFKHIRWCGA
jgi:hypothetical protein